MKNIEQFGGALNKEDYSEKPLDKAYKLISGRDADGLEDWQKAKMIIEVLGDKNWLPEDLSKECLYRIVHTISYPDKETKTKIILYAEDKAGDVFSELGGIDEVHMDQIDYIYNQWKDKTES